MPFILRTYFFHSCFIVFAKPNIWTVSRLIPINCSFHNSMVPCMFSKFVLYVFVCVCTQSCPTLYDPMDSSPPGSSVHGIFQARILKWVVIFYSFYYILNIRDDILPCLFIAQNQPKTFRGSHMDSFLYVELCSFQVCMLKSKPPVPLCVTIFRDRIFTEVIKFK